MTCHLVQTCHFMPNKLQLTETKRLTQTVLVSPFYNVLDFPNEEKHDIPIISKKHFLQNILCPEFILLVI